MGWIDLAQTGEFEGFLWMRLWTYEFYKLRGISELAEKLLDSREGLFSVELFIDWIN
jgi:hypothetical protein